MSEKNIAQLQTLYLSLVMSLTRPCIGNAASIYKLQGADTVTKYYFDILSFGIPFE